MFVAHRRDLPRDGRRPLIQQSGWSSRGLVAGNGGSAGGPLAAAAMTQRPELFGAMLIDIPVLDLEPGKRPWIQPRAAYVR